MNISWSYLLVKDDLKDGKAFSVNGAICAIWKIPDFLIMSHFSVKQNWTIEKADIQ